MKALAVSRNAEFAFQRRSASPWAPNNLFVLASARRCKFEASRALNREERLTNHKYLRIYEQILPHCPASRLPTRDDLKYDKWIRFECLVNNKNVPTHIKRSIITIFQWLFRNLNKTLLIFPLNGAENYATSYITFLSQLAEILTGFVKTFGRRERITTLSTSNLRATKFTHYTIISHYIAGRAIIATSRICN